MQEMPPDTLATPFSVGRPKVPPVLWLARKVPYTLPKASYLHAGGVPIPSAQRKRRTGFRPLLKPSPLLQYLLLDPQGTTKQVWYHTWIKS